jgi:hypothetical protein
VSILLFFLAGAIGALAKDLVKDNKIVLPKKINGEFCFGFLGGTIIGGSAGALVDNNPTTAFLAGYTGSSVIENLVTPTVFKTKANQTIEEIIKMVATEEGIDPSLALRVAKCENQELNSKAKNINTDGSIDRGIYQINDKWHKEVSDEQAFDPYFSTKFFCKRVKEGFISDWNATRKCWDRT